MTIRLKLLIASVVTLTCAVWLVVLVVGREAKLGFARLESQQRTAVLRQFEHEFQRRGEELARAAESLARSESLMQVAADLSQPQPDLSRYVNLASALGAERGLDYLELYSADGTLLSSAQRPARFGYQETFPAKASGGPQFLHREDLLEGPALSLSVARPLVLESVRGYVVAGAKLDQAFVRSIALPENASLAFFPNLEGQNAPAPDASFPRLVEHVRDSKRPAEQDVGAEHLQGRPLFGSDGQVLAVVLIGSSQPEVESLQRTLNGAALAGGAAAVVLGVLASAWFAARISRPLRRIAASASRLAAGDWDIALPPAGSDEVGQLSGTFRNMASQLREQRARLIQSERVAAWRELARRLAHELKNPLFPLQLTVENLQRAHVRRGSDFEEVFAESTDLLQAELRNLKKIVAQFNDFAKMPQPQVRRVSLNEVVERAAKLATPRAEQASVRVSVELDPALPFANADPEMLHQVVQNLALNALDAMPDGGTLTLKTGRDGDRVEIVVSDTGVGLAPEEQQRLFTPYYTTKQHGTGLGLAIVQSVVADHGGSIAVESQPGMGSTFRVSLPVAEHEEEQSAHGAHSAG